MPAAHLIMPLLHDNKVNNAFPGIVYQPLSLCVTDGMSNEEMLSLEQMLTYTRNIKETSITYSKRTAYQLIRFISE